MIWFSDSVGLWFENGPIDPLDLLPGKHLWEKILGYLSDFRDWIRCASLCRLFREIIHEWHWAKVKAFGAFERSEGDGVIIIKLMADASKKGKGNEVAVSREEPFSKRPLVLQSREILSVKESLLATELIAKYAANLEAVSLQSDSKTDSFWHTSELCQRFVANCTTKSLCTVKRLEDNRWTLDDNLANTLQSLSDLISKFYGTLTELEAPLSVPVCQAIAQCHLLTNLFVWERGDGEVQEPLLSALTGKSRLKMLTVDFNGLRLAPGWLIQMILATNAQLEHFAFAHVLRFLAKYYWPRVRHLADHPLKSVSILEGAPNHQEEEFVNVLTVCPKLKELRLYGASEEQSMSMDLRLISRYFDIHSARHGEERELTFSWEFYNDRCEVIDHLQRMAQESTKPANSIVISELNKEVPEVVFRRGKATVRVKVIPADDAPCPWDDYLIV